MNWAQKQRVAYIGRCLLTLGKVNRSDIIKRFGVSAPQAANDFRAFNEAHEGAMRYDVKRKAYVPACLTVLPFAGRDTSAAADFLVRAEDASLEEIVRHDPGMIRDVAAALIWERSN